jgi:hypothetical protein
MNYITNYNTFNVNEEATTSLMNWTTPNNLNRVFINDFAYNLENYLPGSIEDLRQASDKIGGPNIDKALDGLVKDLSVKWVPLVFQEINAQVFNSKGSLDTLRKLILDHIIKQISSIGFIKRKSMGAAMTIKFKNRNNFLTLARKNEEFNPGDLKGIIYYIYELIFNKIGLLNIDRKLPKQQLDDFTDKLFQVQNNFRKSMGYKTNPTSSGGYQLTYILSQSDTAFFDQVMGTVWDAI